MYRCKNWFCARSNNNNYVDVALGEPATTATTATTASRNNSASNNNNSSGRSNNSNIGNSGSSKSNQQTNATTAGGFRGAGATPSYPNHPNAAHSASFGAADEPSPPQAHVVTFLDDTASGSNSGTVTSSRLVTTAELHQAHMLEHHSNLDAIEQADDFIYGPGAGLSLCDDSLPSAKNCYRLVMLGYVYAPWSHGSKTSSVSKMNANAVSHECSQNISRHLIYVVNKNYCLKKKAQCIFQRKTFC